MKEESICLQCQRSSAIPSNRLIQDACGHKKCRSCLLEDVELCKQCILALPCDENQSENDLENAIDISNFDVNVSAFLDTYADSAISDDPEQIINSSENPNNTDNNEGKLAEEDKIFDIDIDDIEIESELDIELPDYIITEMEETSVTYTCTICNKTFLSKCDSKLHEVCAATLPFKCEKCKKMFETKIALNLHHYKHSREPKPHTCTFCRKVFSDKSKLSRHLILHSTDKKHVCSQCAKAFKSRESLKTHLFTHDEEKPFSCHICSAKFNNSSNLKKHSVGHTEERSYMCDNCGKRFKLKWALTVHKKTHLTVRPHKCDMCTKSFINLKDLQRHISVHTESKRFTCGICQTSFRRKDNLRRHIKNTHPGMQAEIIENPVNLPQLSNSSSENPNAINVITSIAPSSVTTFSTVMADSSQHSNLLTTDSLRNAGSIVNAPVKLAFKPPAFKNNYNIGSDGNVVLSDNIPPSYSTSRGINSTLCSNTNSLTTPSSASYSNICQTVNPIRNRWLNNSSFHSSKFPIKSPLSKPPSRILGRDEISPLTYVGVQQLMDTGAQLPLPAFKEQHDDLETSSLHYETSFQNTKHAMIKNIKFKVPEQYTKLFKQNVKPDNSDVTTSNNTTSTSNNNNNANSDCNFNFDSINDNNLSLQDSLTNANLIINGSDVSLL